MGWCAATVISTIRESSSRACRDGGDLGLPGDDHVNGGDDLGDGLPDDPRRRLSNRCSRPRWASSVTVTTLIVVTMGSMVTVTISMSVSATI